MCNSSTPIDWSNFNVYMSKIIKELNNQTKLIWKEATKSQISQFTAGPTHDLKQYGINEAPKHSY